MVENTLGCLDQIHRAVVFRENEQGELDIHMHILARERPVSRETGKVPPYQNQLRRFVRLSGVD
jgi:hypothetical protein